MRIESDGFTMEVVKDYEGVTLYFDGDYAPPNSIRRPTEAEFNAAHRVIIEHLNRIGTATEEVDEYDDADFTLGRQVDPRAAINVVSDLHSPKVIDAIISAQRELGGGYAINLDSHPAYVSVVPDGRVIGYASEGEDYSEGAEILHLYGFDLKAHDEQDGGATGD